MYSLKVSVIEDKLREKLVTEFQHMRNQATGTLAQFMDYITYGYMIDNIVLLITGTLHQRPISELVGKCHPLGSFEQMEAIHIARCLYLFFSFFPFTLHCHVQVI